MMPSVRLIVGSILLAAVLGAAVGCGGGDDAVPLSLAVDSTERATLDSGRDTIVSEDDEHRLTYRFSLERVTSVEGISVAITPVTAMDAGPFEQGLLAGALIELDEPLPWPGRLDIELGSTSSAALRDSLDEGMVAVGIRYDPGSEELTGRLLTVADDRSTIHLDVFESGVHGVVIGDPGDLKQLPKPDDPDARYLQELIVALLEGHERVRLDSARDAAMDAEVRPKVAEVLEEWLAESIYPQLDDAIKDPAGFETALQATVRWHQVAASLQFVREPWFGAGDAFASEGRAVNHILLSAYYGAFLVANEECKVSGDPAKLLHLVNLDRQGTEVGLIDDRLAPLLDLEAFCITFEIESVEAPTSFEEGTSSSVAFEVIGRVGSGNRLLTPDELDVFRVEGEFEPVASSLVRLSPPQQGLGDQRNRFSVETDARDSRAGSDWEGSLQLSVSVLGGVAVHGEETVRIDIEPRPER